MGATGETQPGGGRREGADEAVMEALRERAQEIVLQWLVVRALGSMGLAESEMRKPHNVELVNDMTNALAQAARPPEPGEAPAGAPTGVELREAFIARLNKLREYCYNGVCGNSDQCGYHEAFNHGIATAIAAVQSLHPERSEAAP